MKIIFSTFTAYHVHNIFTPQVYICKYVFVVIIMKVIIKISCLLHDIIRLVMLLHCFDGDCVGGGGGGGGSIPV